MQNPFIFPPHTCRFPLIFLHNFYFYFKNNVLYGNLFDQIIYANFYKNSLFHLMLLIRGNNVECKSKRMILVHVFIYLGVRKKVKCNQRRKYSYIWVPSYKITHFIFSLYCVVVQHNNKLRTIENKQERNGVGVRCKNAELCLIDNTDEKHLKQSMVQTYP